MRAGRQPGHQLSQGVHRVDGDCGEDHSPSLALQPLLGRLLRGHPSHRPLFPARPCPRDLFPPCPQVARQHAVGGGPVLLRHDFAPLPLGLERLHRAPDLERLGLDVLSPVDVEGPLVGVGAPARRHPQPGEVLLLQEEVVHRSDRRYEVAVVVLLVRLRRIAGQRFFLHLSQAVDGLFVGGVGGVTACATAAAVVRTPRGVGCEDDAYPRPEQRRRRRLKRLDIGGGGGARVA